MRREIETAWLLFIPVLKIESDIAAKPGVAMRFPRISRLRRDKPPRDAGRLETLERMLISETANPSPEPAKSH